MGDKAVSNLPSLCSDSTLERTVKIDGFKSIADLFDEVYEKYLHIDSEEDFEELEAEYGKYLKFTRTEDTYDFDYFFPQSHLASVLNVNSEVIIDGDTISFKDNHEVYGGFSTKASVYVFHDYQSDSKRKMWTEIFYDNVRDDYYAKLSFHLKNWLGWNKYNADVTINCHITDSRGNTLYNKPRTVINNYKSGDSYGIDPTPLLGNQYYFSVRNSAGLRSAELIWVHNR